MNLPYLISRAATATGKDAELDDAVHEIAPKPKVVVPLRYTYSVDDALSLLPSTACNHQLVSFCGHGRADMPQGSRCWAFTFSDTKLLMGRRAAKEQVARMRADWPSTLRGTLAGPPRIQMEKAIAEHFVVFSFTHAANPALAVLATALQWMLRKAEGRSP